MDLNKWLPLILTILTIGMVFLIINILGYRIYFMNEDDYPLFINQEELSNTQLSDQQANLIKSLKDDGIIISAGEFTNQITNYFSWILTIIVAIVGIISLAFGFSIDKQIKLVIHKELKQSWIELMKIDKDVDETIGGIIDDKIGERFSDIYSGLEKIQTKLEELTDNSTIIQSNSYGTQNNKTSSKHRATQHSRTDSRRHSTE